MENTITLTAEQMSALERGESITITPPKKQWEPAGGAWYISGNGLINEGPHGDSYREFGTERPTKELSEKARDAMRIHNRLLSYVHEHAPDFEFNPVFLNYFVFKDHSEDKWKKGNIDFYHPGLVYMPGDVARSLVEKLNNGTVVL